MSFHWDGPAPDAAEVDALLEQIQTPTEARLVQLQQAIRGGATCEQINRATAIDPWFIDQIQQVEDVARQIMDAEALSAGVLREAKRHGFSDAQIASLRSMPEEVVREIRRAYNIHPVLNARGSLGNRTA